MSKTIKSLNARLIGATVPMDDNKSNTLRFYEHISGQKPGQSLSDSYETYYVWGSGGVKLIFDAAVHDSGWNPGVMLNFRVDDLEDAEQQIQNLGGKKIAGPFPLTVHDDVFSDFRNSFEDLHFGSANEVTKLMGNSIIVMDPSGNRIILTELRPYAEKFYENGEISRHEHLQHKTGTKTSSLMP